MKQVKRKSVLTVALASIVLGLLAVGALALPNASSASAAGVSNAHSSSHHGGNSHKHSSFGITVSPNSGNPGDTFIVNGTGFTPNGPVQVSVGNGAPVTATADSLGNFNATLTAPGTPGSYRVTAIDQTTSNTASATYRVNGPRTSNPKISVFPTTVNPNQVLTVNGSGFTPNGTVAVITPNGNGSFNVNGTTADAHGNISVQLAAASIPGTFRVTAGDAATGATATANYTVR